MAAARRSHRFVVLQARAPTVGTVLRRGDRALTIESFGKSFRVNGDMPSLQGELRGHEGEPCCYAYYRDATAAEAEAVASGLMT